jgi:hypothetical protein
MGGGKPPEKEQKPAIEYTAQATTPLVNGEVKLTIGETALTAAALFDTAEIPYKLRISKSGVAVLTYETKATQNNIYTFKGQLYRTPIIPK